MDYFKTLMDLSKKKEIPYTKRQLEKMSEEKLEEVYNEYKKQELDDFNEAVTDILISKFDEFMKRYDLIKQDSEMGLKLQKKKLFREDLKSFVSFITPVLPAIGILEGIVTVGGEIIDKMGEEKVKPSGHDIPNEEETKKEETENST